MDGPHDPQPQFWTGPRATSASVVVQDPREVQDLLNRGEAQLVLVVPPGFARELDAGRTAPVQALVDGCDANTATVVLNYARATAATYSQRVGVVSWQPAIRVQSRVWYNEELLSRNMIVPGLVTVIMMIIASMLTSLTIAREWERGTMEQLAATPVSGAEVVLGKLLPYLVIGLVDVALSSALGVWLFGVPFRGSPVLLMVLSAAFLTGALSLGLVVSALTRSQLLATRSA